MIITKTMDIIQTMITVTSNKLVNTIHEIYSAVKKIAIYNFLGDQKLMSARLMLTVPLFALNTSLLQVTNSKSKFKDRSTTPL